MGYKCENCGKGILVEGVLEPIRACKCTRKVLRLPNTKLEKFLSFFGKKYYNIIPSKIIVGLSSSLIGTCKLKG